MANRNEGEDEFNLEGAEDGQGEGRINERVDGLLLLHDLEHYIRSRGIENNSENVAPNQNDIEAQRRVCEAQEYQEEVHKRVFGDEKDSGEKAGNESRNQLIEMYNGTKVDIIAANSQTVEGVALDQLIETCDTVFALVKSSLWTSKEGSQIENKNPRCPNKEIALLEFDADAVKEFIGILTGAISYDNINDEHVVSCCKIAHFLQCKTVLNPLVDILVESVDSRNCLSLCSLADQLDLPPLFEASVSTLTSSLDRVQDHELWNEFPKDLQNHVITFRNAIYSSIMSRGQKAKIFFSSSDEFLAIFSDHIRDQKERLKEATLRQEQIIEGRRRHGGRHCDIYGGSVRDAEGKIRRQEKRIETLDIFYKEQKKIFQHSALKSTIVGSDDNGSDDKSPDRVPFVLG